VPDRPPFTVLVVDDSEDNRVSLAVLLRHHGYHVLEASGGRQALDLVHDADLAIVDVRLPDLSGLEVCRRIKADPATALVPVILLSGHFTRSENKAEGLEGGGDAYFIKPVDPLELLAQVKALLRIRQTEQQLQEQARILDQVHDAVVATDLAGNITRWNKGAERLFGYPADEVLGRHVGLLYHPEEREGTLAELFAALRQGRGHEVEKRVRTRAGEELVVHTSVSPLRTARGRLSGFIGFSVDVTQRRRAEEALRASERHLRAVIETNPECIKLVAPDGTLLEINAAGLTLLEADSAEQLVGRPVEELVVPEDRAAYRALHECVCRGVAGTLEFGMAGLKGTRRRLETHAVPLPGPDGRTLYLGVTRDVTEQRRLEEQLRQAQKMEAVGQLAGGVAHDFNNLLQVITGFGQLILDRLSADDPLRDMVVEVKKAGERAATLTRQLLAFSRKELIAPRVLDVAALLADTERMLRRMLGEDVELRTLSDGPALVKADPGQLTQVLLNLCVNARDAMPTGGRLTIETCVVQRDEADLRAHPGAAPGDYVLLAVRDTGRGIPAEALPHIWEPFFTTKGLGQGTGLGLAVVHGVVAQTGGHVEVQSAPGQGTIFRLYLPHIGEEGRPAKAMSGAGAMPEGTGTVLLVEDEEGVRGLAATILRRCGYQVLEAADKESALRAAAEPGRIDLLLTDVVLPRGSGREVAEALLRQHPGIKVLYVSGYTEDAVLRHGVQRQQVDFLAKPFTPATLAQKVRTLLDG
jgi:two-component system cell cycle sensor histidine kinase/response regulator CckA